MSYIREFSPRHPEKRDVFWCDRCQSWVKLSEMKSFTTDDDWVIDRLCPGCDFVLVSVVYDPNSFLRRLL